MWRLFLSRNIETQRARPEIYRSVGGAFPVPQKLNTLAYFETLCVDTQMANILINSRCARAPAALAGCDTLRMPVARWLRQQYMYSCTQYSRASYYWVSDLYRLLYRLIRFVPIIACITGIMH
eukprot:COSAG01_NODE_40117_length_467_cov_1.942935_1_plen_123_part_00